MKHIEKYRELEDFCHSNEIEVQVNAYQLYATAKDGTVFEGSASNEGCGIMMEEIRKHINKQ